MLAKGVSYVESNDLSGAYTTTASPVVKLQIAKQGYRCVFIRSIFNFPQIELVLMFYCRLAKWLDAIVAAV